ncbi:MAG: glutamate--tRNA ligase [Ruminococcus sp.]|nr:glutamate--tRNA ligase [Ruminococcus sp.]MBQ8905683.1 glutamate--tRNA ligase [Ruminococcus sp.]
MSNRVRTRFAPSPTGYMHIGNLRTALYTYFIARKNGGDFILRIEDTDQERYVEGATDVIYKTLRLAGMNWDEGPDVGGDFGPYVQSERMGMFKEYAEQLVKAGKAYYCFCDKERLAKLHEADALGAMYDGHCRDLPEEEVAAKLAAGTPYVIRQKMPKTGETTFHDEIYGDITVENAALDDQILIKTDGMPTYNFANVVDDHLMGITHVVRGNEYLSSAPKYNLLYEAFGWEVPKYVHCAPVMKDAHAKLSKRNGDASFEDLIAKGYLAEAVVNYIALLGWAPKGEEEIFTLEQLIEEFSLDGISKAPAIFDPVKLKAINAVYVRNLPLDAYIEKIKPYLDQAIQRTDYDIRVLAQVLQPRTEVLPDVIDQVDFIDALPAYDNAMYCHKKMKTTEESSLTALNAVLPVLEAIDDWNVTTIHDALMGLAAQMEVKNGWLLWPVRTAVSGKQVSPGGGVELCAILGKADTLCRIRKGIAQLGG